MATDKTIHDYLTRLSMFGVEKQYQEALAEMQKSQERIKAMFENCEPLEDHVLMRMEKERGVTIGIVPSGGLKHATHNLLKVIDEQSKIIAEKTRGSRATAVFFFDEQGEICDIQLLDKTTNMLTKFDTPIDLPKVVNKLSIASSFDIEKESQACPIDKMRHDARQKERERLAKERMFWRKKSKH